MNIQDPISDMLTRMRNAAMRYKASSSKSNNGVTVSLPHSKLKESIARTMKEEGFIKDYNLQEVVRDNKVIKGQYTLNIDLKFHNGEHVISHMKALSKPSLRIYKKREDLPYFKAGLGVVIVSTSAGVMTAKKARRDHRCGGELLVEIF